MTSAGHGRAGGQSAVVLLPLREFALLLWSVFVLLLVRALFESAGAPAPSFEVDGCAAARLPAWRCERSLVNGRLRSERQSCRF